MSKDNVQTALDIAATIPNQLRKARSGSLIEFSKPTRVEPIVLLDNKLTNVSFMPDVMGTITSIFGGYYLQAVSLMVDVGSVDVIGLLDSVNPERDPLASGWDNVPKAFALESYKHQLPVPGEKVGVENFGLEARSSNNDSIQTLRTPTTLAVGKMLEVKVSSEGNEATFPVSVRLTPVASRPEDIVRTMSSKSKDTTFSGRVHAWRSGQISFVKDLILCQDLIAEHRKALINDKTGMYRQSVKREKKNILSTILSGNISVGTASNIVVISSGTAKSLENEIGGKLKNFRVREKMFKDTYVMLLVVIDPEWEGITIYHRSIESPSDLSLSDVKQMGKKDVDIGEILKAYQLGNSPSF